MKTVLILLIIVFCVLGFLFFIWYISKKDTHNPIEELKKNDEREAAFIKQRQKMYHQQEKTEVKKIEILKSEDRGKLFERAIERKRTAYKDDDEEYQNRIRKLKEEQEEKHQDTPPIQPLKEQTNEPILTEDTPESEKKNDIDWYDLEKKDTPSLPPQMQKQDVQGDFQKRKEEVEKKEKERKMDIQTLRAEILSEVENLRKRRLAFIEIPN